MCECKCGHGWVGVGARVHTGMSVAWVDVDAGTHDVCRCVQRDCSSGSGVGGGETPSRLWPSCPGLQTLLGSLFAGQGLEQMDAGVPRGWDGWAQEVPRSREGWARGVPRGQDGWAQGVSRGQGRWARECPGAREDGCGGAQGPGQSWSLSVSPLHGLRASPVSSHPRGSVPCLFQPIVSSALLLGWSQMIFLLIPGHIFLFLCKSEEFGPEAGAVSLGLRVLAPCSPRDAAARSAPGGCEATGNAGTLRVCWCLSGAACRAEPLSAPPDAPGLGGCGCWAPTPPALPGGSLSRLGGFSTCLPLLVPSRALEGPLRVCRRGRLCRRDGGSPGAHPPSLPLCAHGLEPATAPHPKPFSRITVLWTLMPSILKTLVSIVWFFQLSRQGRNRSLTGHVTSLDLSRRLWSLSPRPCY